MLEMKQGLHCTVNVAQPMGCVSTTPKLRENTLIASNQFYNNSLSLAYIKEYGAGLQVENQFSKLRNSAITLFLDHLLIWHIFTIRFLCVKYYAGNMI